MLTRALFRFALPFSWARACAVPPGGGAASSDASGDAPGDRGDGANRADGGEGKAPPPRRRHRTLKALAWVIAAIVLLVALLAGALYGALTTERGTAWAWRAAVALLDGKLAGTLEGGTLARGVRLSNVGWYGPDGTTVKVDRVDGQWAVQGFGRAPWRFVVDYLHVGDIDARVVPSSEPSQPMTLPRNLQLPLGLEVRDLQVDKLTLHQGASTTEFSRLLFHGRSDGRHHEAAVERLDTPFGAVSAHAQLDGVRPFVLAGDVGYAGKVNGEDVQVNGTLGGSLEALTADIAASGMKLTGRAHVEATPFAAVPLQRATLAFDHVNPQAFAPGAPFADLAVRAQLQPVPGGAAGVPAALAAAASGNSAALAEPAQALGPAASASAALAASPASASSATVATGHSDAAGFTVAGDVSIVNAKPGTIGDQLLPLIDAHASVVLDARTQRIPKLAVRLVKTATITGGGAISGRDGRFDLHVAGLDLSTIQSSVRATSFAGPLDVRLAGDVQSVTLDLADPKAALRVQGKITQDPARLSFNDVRVTSGAGRIDLSGALKHDANASYQLKAVLTNFDPLSLTSQLVSKTPPAGAKSSPKPARQASAKSTSTTASDALNPKRNLALNPSLNPSLNPAQTGEQAQAQKHVENARQTEAPGASAQSRPTSTPPKAAPARRIEARVNGTLSASGMLAPTLTTRAEFKLGPSVYDDLPLTGQGLIQLAGTRILPSRANLSVAGNVVDLQGSFGAPGDRLRFRVDAPQLDRLGFGVAGQVAANGDLTGSFAHPNVALDYKADHVAFGENRVDHAQGRAEARDGANGALAFSADATGIAAAGVDISTLSARLTGTRARHTLTANAKGKVQGASIDFAVAANGGLTDTREGSRWDGTVTQLENRGTPGVKLEAPLKVSAGAGKVTLGATRLVAEGAALDLKSFDLDHGRVQSAGALTNVSVARLMLLRQQLTGEPATLRTDLVFDGDWNFSIGQSASGYVQLKRRSGDITAEIARGIASFGIGDVNARAAFSGGNRLTLTAHAQASRVGVLDVDANTTLVARNGMLTVADESPIGGTIKANVPSLRTTGGLLGPNYLLDGHLALDLGLGGTVAKPNLTGLLSGDGISATVVDQGVELKDGVIRIALSRNLVDFQQLEFHGATSGTLRATGRVALDNAEPDLTASIVADKLELFASPDRKLSLSGSASIANGGHLGGMMINGKFTVDHALFDLPESAAPSLGDDVVIVRPDGTTVGGKPPIEQTASTKPAPRFAPRANIDINLGSDFRFRGQGADLGLAGTITATSEPDVPLRAVGNVRVTEGSSYTAFGTKLGIENGFFTFNGPVGNPGINILAMRRNQQVEAGVQVTGTVQAPVAKLVSEPNVPDNEKLSWLLFGHGTDQGNNVGQQSAMTTALALLGSASGKRIAQSIGLDEFSIGRSEVGLTDPEVVMIAKAINQRLVIGYEQGLQSASNAVKATINLSRYWSVVTYGGTFYGADILYTRRFDRIRW
ncbi:autotransporter secretion inner membrane protein TamB [Paraburkholderia eburnea]|uniref:Autotransporter secretion inner membrane protein TamB n=1 Tax=Paraburkholderia eburnea TaxID=1189126 RepID=A0A2S4MM18_9BURK|nr:translocation/assembly module TamB domain-containing protein [Paraburkholderia eburnea]POR55814.1 autotransporter secretion inner membrane protein TamB [Paraburkholderia eburnea]PRZ26941.1 autotransporter secretion inner membrane protein TamB [Paraburkholderia eburnea]